MYKTNSRAYHVRRSVKLLLAFPSTVILGFCLLEIYDQDFCYLLEKYVFGNGASSFYADGAQNDPVFDLLIKCLFQLQY
jgi:hypothetical protein